MKKILLLLFLIIPLALIAQDSEIFEYARFRLGVEAGVGFLDGKTVAPSAVRENQSYYSDNFYASDYYYCGYVNDYQSIPHYYIGVKPEFSINNSLSIAVGLRFLYSKSELNSDKDYFLWKVSENGLITNYARVKSVKQNTLYVGLPVEFTVYTYKRDIIVRHFFRTGFNFNYLLFSKTAPYFESEAMNKYAEKVKNDVAAKKRFTPTIFVGTGLKIGRMNKPFGTIEIRVPISFEQGFSSFAKTTAGIELSTAVYIPLGKEKLTCIYD
jgi:hypothetical protein